MDLFGETIEEFRRPGVIAGHEEFPEIFELQHAVEFIPSLDWEETGEWIRIEILDGGFGGDEELCVLGSDGEMVDVIAEVVAILKNTRFGIDLDEVAEATLAAFAARLHVKFHDGLADRRVITEACLVLDRIVH